jgi:uncharacterized protein
MSGTVTLHIRGETLLLHPDRALLWPERATAIVADTHFGKSSVFGRHGIAVPGGSDAQDQARLSRLIAAHGIGRLIVLGDFLHAPLDPGSAEADALQRWSTSFAAVRIQVIAGNHDRGVSHGWRGPLDWIAGEYVESPFRFVHDVARQAAEAGLFSLSGHIHPVIALRGLRKRGQRVPVFWHRPDDMVLPSFGSFTGGCLIKPARGEQVFAVGPDHVIAFPRR